MKRAPALPQFCMSSTPIDAWHCTSRQGQAPRGSAEYSESAWITQLEALRGQEHQHTCALQVPCFAGAAAAAVSTVAELLFASLHSTVHWTLLTCDHMNGWEQGVLAVKLPQLENGALPQLRSASGLLHAALAEFLGGCGVLTASMTCQCLNIPAHTTQHFAPPDGRWLRA